MTTTAAETTERARPTYLERMVEQTGLDRDALTILYDEHGNRRRFEVLGGRLVEKPIGERSSHSQERTALLFHLKMQNPRNEAGSPCPVRLPDGDLYAGDVVMWRPETPMVGEPAFTDGFHGMPELFVEVVASWKAAQDAAEKRHHCAACEVPHFWVADLRRGVYLLYDEPEGEDYARLTEVTDRAALRLPPELT
jgi:Uma2 family endonuclease